MRYEFRSECGDSTGSTDVEMRDTATDEDFDAWCAHSVDSVNAYMQEDLFGFDGDMGDQVWLDIRCLVHDDVDGKEVHYREGKLVYEIVDEPPKQLDHPAIDKAFSFVGVEWIS